MLLDGAAILCILEEPQTVGSRRIRCDYASKPFIPVNTETDGTRKCLRGDEQRPSPAFIGAPLIGCCFAFVVLHGHTGRTPTETNDCCAASAQGSSN